MRIADPLPCATLTCAVKLTDWRRRAAPERGFRVNCILHGPCRDVLFPEQFEMVTRLGRASKRAGHGVEAPTCSRSIGGGHSVPAERRTPSAYARRVREPHTRARVGPHAREHGVHACDAADPAVADGWPRRRRRGPAIRQCTEGGSQRAGSCWAVRTPRRPGCQKRRR